MDHKQQLQRSFSPSIFLRVMWDFCFGLFFVSFVCLFCLFRFLLVLVFVCLGFVFGFLIGSTDYMKFLFSPAGLKDLFIHSRIILYQ